MRLLPGRCPGVFSLPRAASRSNIRRDRCEVVIGYAAGSSTDIVGRVMADRLSRYWKQTRVRRDARPAPPGNLAADAVAKAAADGYTLLFAQNGLAISAAALPNLPYKPETDLARARAGRGDAAHPHRRARIFRRRTCAS